MKQTNLESQGRTADYENMNVKNAVLAVDSIVVILQVRK